MSAADPRADLADGPARERAVRRFEAPLVLEAGAGTGKTATLVGRVATWCVGPGWERHRNPERSDHQIAERVLTGLVAITFTEAAAAEMAERIGEAFDRLARQRELPTGLYESDLAHHGVELETAAERAEALFGALDQLSVSTIHGYCSRLVTAHPFELGLHPSPTVDPDGAEVERAVREVVEEAMGDAYDDEGPNAAAWLALARLEVGPLEIAEAVKTLIGRGATARSLPERAFEPAPLAEFASAVSAAARPLGLRIAAALDQLGRAKATKALGELLGQLQGVLDPPPRDARGLVEAIAQLGDTSSARNKLAELEKKLNQSETKAFEGQEAELFHEVATLRPLFDALCALDPERLELGLSVVRPLVVATLERLRLRGVLTFDDLLTKAAELLERSPAARRRERRRIDQLLVDEFQDTDERQCALVRALAVEPLEGEAPEDRPGLFVVGDPKQSIYGWRRADLAAFRRFVEDVEAAGGQTAALAVNFRSNQEVLDEVERVLAPTMDAIPGVQARFEPLVAFASAGKQPHPGTPAVEYRLVSAVDGADPAQDLEPKLKSGVATWLDAEEHASAIARAVGAASREAADYDAGRLGFGDHALLLRSMGDLEIYLDALRRHGVPYSVAKDKSYFRRREIVDAISLVSAIVDPTDLLSLVGWLRSPAVGVPDAAWLPLWRAHFPDLAVRLDGAGGPALEALAQMIADAAGALDPDLPGLAAIPDWPAAAIDALAALGELRASLARDPAELFVERLRRRTALELSEARRYLGDFRLANLERFFGRLRTALETRLGDRRSVLRDLRNALREDRDAEEGRPKEAREDAVRVMTVHASKGLQFPHVHLGQLHKRGGGGAKAANDLERFRDDEDVERVGFRLFGSSSLWMPEAERRRARTSQAEVARTLYVALTRAERCLSLGLPWAPDRFESGVPTGPYAGLVDARRGAGRDATRRFADAEDRPPYLDEGPVRFRLVLEAPPALAGGARPGRDEDGAPPPAWDAAAVAEQVAVLARRSVEAAARAARPLVAPASTDAHRLLHRTEAANRFTASADGPVSGPVAGSEDGSGPLDESLDSKQAREVAMAVGSAVHRALEDLELELPAVEAVEAVRPTLEAELERALEGPSLEAARVRTAGLLEALSRGELLQRLRALSDRVLARELPVLLPPLEEETSPDAPLGAWSGAIDLVYLDPGTGEVVVADYKTDRVDDDRLRAERTEAYALQLTRYARALQESLGLDRPPRCELWWLGIDAIERLAAR